MIEWSLELRKNRKAVLTVRPGHELIVSTLAGLIHISMRIGPPPYSIPAFVRGITEGATGISSDGAILVLVSAKVAALLLVVCRDLGQVIERGNRVRREHILGFSVKCMAKHLDRHVYMTIFCDEAEVGPDPRNER